MLQISDHLFPGKILMINLRPFCHGRLVKNLTLQLHRTKLHLEGPRQSWWPLTTACISCSLICSSKNSLIVFIILPLYSLFVLLYMDRCYANQFWSLLPVSLYRSWVNRHFNTQCGNIFCTFSSCIFVWKSPDTPALRSDHPGTLLESPVHWYLLPSVLSPGDRCDRA